MSEIQEQIDELRNILEENLRYTKSIHEFTPKDSLERRKELEKYVRDNLEYTKACYSLIHKIHRWILWQKIFSVIKILIILIPLMFALIYLPPFLKDAFGPYSELLKELQKAK